MTKETEEMIREIGSKLEGLVGAVLRGSLPYPLTRVWIFPTNALESL